MSKNREGNSAFVPLLTEFLKFLSALLAIVPAIWAFIAKNGIIIAVAIVLIAVAIVVFSYREKISKRLLSFFLNLTAPRKKYKLIKKEIIYRFIDRENMQLEKNFEVQVIGTGFKCISDKYSWTGGTPLEVKSKYPEHTITTYERKFGLIKYEISVGEETCSPKGPTIPMGSIIDNIKDPERKSSPHLSAGIYEETDMLILRVEFPAELHIKDAKKVGYIHYYDDDADEFKPIENPIVNKNNVHYLEYKVPKPLYGGRYMIEWKFVDNDTERAAGVDK